jgi:CIC family chloride channel protein
MRAPLTGAIFALELTGDLRTLPALLAASTAAYAVTVLLMKRSILTEKIARRGQHITREYGIDPYELTQVSEVMARNVDTLSADLTVPDAVSFMAAGSHRIYPVVDAMNRPVGMLSRAVALQWSVEGGHEQDMISEHISDADLPVIYPDQVVARAIDLMLATEQGRLPVIDRSTGALVGLLTRKHLLQVRAAVNRSEQERQSYLAVKSGPK